MKYEYVQDDGDKVGEGVYNVYSRYVVLFFKQDDGGGNYYCGKEYVVDGEYQRGIKNVQRFVEEVDLSVERKCQDQGQDVGEGVSYNWYFLEEVFNGDVQIFDGGYREGFDYRVDEDVNEDIFLFVTWGDDEDEDEVEYQQKYSKYDVFFRKGGRERI